MSEIRPKGRGFDVSAPGANTDVIASNVVWESAYPCRVTIQCAVGTVVNLMVTRDSTEKALGLNGNSAIAAGGPHSFDVPGLEVGDELNLQIETDGAIDFWALDEVR